MGASGENVAGRGGSRCKGRSILVCFRKSQRPEPEGVSEQLVRGLIGHCKDFSADPEMLHPWKWTCSDLDLKRLALTAVWRIGLEAQR